MTTIPDIQAYRTLVFDCDGVVLDSNLVKTQAFYDTALPYGIEAARQIVEYHTVRGGVSRYKKFEHFIEHILQRESEPDLLQPLLDEFSRNVRTGLLHCNVASRLEELRAQTPKATWMIVSGGDQAELRSIFTERGLQELFDGGIYGSPDTKDTILRRERLLTAPLNNRDCFWEIAAMITRRRQMQASTSCLYPAGQKSLTGLIL